MLSCSCCIEPELSIMNTMSRSLFTDSLNVGAVGIGVPVGSGIAASSSRAAASAARERHRDEHGRRDPAKGQARET